MKALPCICQNCYKDCKQIPDCEHCGGEQVFEKYDGGWPCLECKKQHSANYNDFCSKDCKEIFSFYNKKV
jgi:hypothetical protein